jgi:hypothetical protein
MKENNAEAGRRGDAEKNENDAATQVYHTLGCPGLLESLLEICNLSCASRASPTLRFSSCVCPYDFKGYTVC